MSRNAYRCVKCNATEAAESVEGGRGDWLTIGVLSHAFSIGDFKAIRDEAVFCGPACAIQVLQYVEVEERKRRGAA